jgi:hypothetical protein
MGLKKYLLISALLFAQHNYSLERIQSESVDKGKVSKVYVAPGLATLMKFPCVIKEAIVGNNSLVKAVVSEKDSQSLIVNLSGPNKTATNLIVRCISQESPFVFDVISSRTLHQDYVNISAGYGRPAMKGLNLNLIESSSGKSAQAHPKSRVQVKTKKLIRSYKVKE